MIKTSVSHPLRIDSMMLPHCHGVIGMTICPGKKGPGIFSDRWDRDLDTDLNAICQWGAAAMVSLVEDHEFDLLGVSTFKDRVSKFNFLWFHLPIVDVSVPCSDFEKAWSRQASRIHEVLYSGGKIVLHCRGGLGRTGLVAARLLVDFGLDAEQAIRQVRSARPDTIETAEQEQHVFQYYARNKRRNLDHYLGCMLGGAIGDALGSAVEFDTLAEIRQRYGFDGITSYAEAYGRSGSITDDTQMALFTAEGLLHATSRAGFYRKKPSFTACAWKSYRRWMVTQGELDKNSVNNDGWLINLVDLHHRRAPGNTCLSSLKRNHLHRFGRALPFNESKGCGAVMRMAPVGLLFQSPFLSFLARSDLRHDRAFDVGRNLGYLTHAHPSGYLPGAFLSALISRIIHGEDLSAALDHCCQTLSKQHGAKETLRAVEKARALASQPSHASSPNLLSQLGEGWVGNEALAIGIYCAIVAKTDFDLGICLAVNHDGDSDSTGAVAGNILGALLGCRAIGKQWLDKLELRRDLERMATDLFLGYMDSADWWERYPHN
ncbi:MAG: ADP-ribosylglycohydrolase family protein [Deltaproteobacteria bacterium]|jgi:ADP-ribosylglycohydrolase|nr:ADP-ribosylglycohydrolase family protein [Deltaproteobacteria bacterium]